MKNVISILLFLQMSCFLVFTTQAQNASITVKGEILDETGFPLPGANVLLKGTSIGTVSNIDGQYSLTFAYKGQSEIVYTFISYQTTSIKIKKSGEYIRNIVLKTDDSKIDEVIVVAYGTVKKENLTGSVSRVDSDVLETRPVSQATQALQGVVPGLNINNDAGGELDGTLNINIRGVGTIGEGSSGSPLVLIDGIESSLSSVNPSDIESISVLKDAAAASIYGSRAPFGVILVTTKSGSKGKTSVTYSNSFRFSTPINIPDRMNSLDYAYYVNDLYVNSGKNLIYKDKIIQNIKDYRDTKLAYGTHPNSTNTTWLDDRSGYANTDWYDVHLKKISFAQDHNISIKGGSEKVNYYVSAGILDQEGLFRFSDEKLTRKTVSAKLSTKLNDKVKMNLNYRFIRKNSDKPSAQNMRLYHNLSRSVPTSALYTPYGDYMPKSLIKQLQDGGRLKGQKDLMYSKVEFIYEPIKNWTINADFNSRIENHDNSKHIARIGVTQPNGTREHIALFAGYPCRIELNDYDITAMPSAGQNYFEIGSKQVNYTAMNFYTNYLKNIGEHEFKVLLGTQSELFKQHYSILATDNIASDQRPFISQDGNKFVFERKGEWSNLGVFSRLNYNYKQIYLLEMNMRADGASRFPTDQRWGFFPSASFGWNIARENFWKPISETVNRFKFRSSWGLLGNQNTNSFYPYFQKMNINNGKWIVDANVPSSLNMPLPYSASISWEKIETYNIGIDLGAFNNRLSSTFDVYTRKTSDMIGPAPAKPGVFGAVVPKTNNAELLTRGWELELSWRDKINKDLSYDISFVMSDATTEVTRYSNPENLLFVNGKPQFYQGKNMGEIWGYKTQGIAKTDEQMSKWIGKNQPSFGTNWSAGDMMYKDLNNDKIIDSGAQQLDDNGDLAVIGNSTPRYLFGIHMGINYKAFDISAFVQGVGKRDALLSGGSFYPGINQWQISPFSDHLDYFRPEGSSLGANTQSYYPRPYIGDKNYKPQTHFLQDASYVRLKNVQIAYTLPKHLTHKLGISNLRVYVSGENLFTVSKLKMFDPEGIKDLINGSGKTYPMSATYSVGLNMNF